MTKYNKIFLLFIILLFAFMSIATATNTNDSSITKTLHKDIKKVEHKNLVKDYKLADNKINMERKYQKMANKIRKNVKNITSKNILINKTSNKKNKKTDTNIEEVDITPDNFSKYFRVQQSTVYLGKGISSSENNLTINLQYIPDNVDCLAIEGNNKNYENRTLTVDAKGLPPINNIGLSLENKFKTCTVQNFNVTYDNDYQENSFFSLTGNGSYVLNNVSINVLKDGIDKSNAVDVQCKALIENCNIRAKLDETGINWGGKAIPDAMGVSITGDNSIFRNNTLDIVSNGLGGTYSSLYALYTKGRNITVVSNNISLTKVEGYAYAFDSRCIDSFVSDNNITVTAHSYANGITCEKLRFNNNIFKNNYVNVTASYGSSPAGNPAVAYVMQMLDYEYYGGTFIPSGGHPMNNSFINNTLIGSAGQIYGMEIYGTCNTTLSGNYINITGRAPMGMAVCGGNISMSNNDIIINAEHNRTEGTADYFASHGCGLWNGRNSGGGIVMNNNTIITENCTGIYGLQTADLLIENNTIIKKNHDYAIDFDKSNNNIIRYNKLNARNHKGDDSVNPTGNNIISDNTYFRVSQIQLITQQNADIKDNIPLLVVLKEDNNNAMVDTPFTLNINGEEIPVVTDEYGMYTYNYTPTSTGTVEITATYNQNEEFLGCSMTTLINVTDKDSIINQLTDTIQEQEETIQEQEQQINNKNTSITQKQTEITQKQQQTQALNNTVNQLQQEIKDTTNQIKKQNNTNNNQNRTKETKSNITITITPDKKTLKAGQKVTLNIKMTDKKTSKAVTSATLNIKIGSKTVKANVKNGVTKVTYTVPRGSDAQTIKVSTSYSSDKYNKATANTQFKVTKTTPTIKKTSITYKNKKTTIKATIKDATKKLLNKNVKVTVKVDGKAVLKNKVIKNGKISLSFKKALKKGNHKIIITSKATKAFNKASFTTVLKV